MLSFTKEHIEKSLQELLSRPDYLANSVLDKVDKETATDFISKYCGVSNGVKSQPHKIRTIIGYPQDSQQLDGLIVVTQGESTENLPSIGGIEGEYESFTGHVHNETCEITVNPNGSISFMTTYPAHKVEGIREFAIKQELVEIDGVTITLDIGGMFSEGLFKDGDLIHLTYEEKLPKELYGLNIGYSALEQVNVSLFSMNYGTMVCIGAMMKAIIILMRQTLESQLLCAVNTVQTSAIMPVDSEIVPETNPNMIFTQDIILQCQVSYAIDKNSNADIESFKVKKNFGSLL